MAERFVVVIADLKNIRSEFATTYSLKRNYSYLLVLDRDGKVLSQVGDRALKFDDQLIEEIEAIGSDYRIAQQVILEYLSTWINVDLADVSRIEELVSQLDSRRYATRESASQKLESLGEPTYQFLLNYEPADAESRSRLHAIQAKLEARRNIIIRDGLDHNIEYLAKHATNNPQVVAHLKKILPEDVDLIEIEDWWKANVRRYHWDVDEKLFVLQDVVPATDDDRDAGEKSR